MTKNKYNCISNHILSVSISVLFLILSFIFQITSPFASETGLYGRVGMGLSISEDSTFYDKSPSSTDPPALFGDAIGEDGRRIGARGDFGESFLIEVGVGWQFDWFHSELNVSYRPEFEFSGDANFINVPLDQQPVNADMTSLITMVTCIADLDRMSSVFQWGPVCPFIGASAGFGYNRIDQMVYRFPSISDDSVTITPDGDWSGFVYGFTGGLEYPVNKTMSIELAYRYCDAGKVETEAGAAQIVRSGNTLDLVIAPTEADVSMHEVVLSLVYFF